MATGDKVVKLKVASTREEETPEEHAEGFPEYVKIGHLIYSVRPMDQLETAVSGNLGYCDDQNLQIAVAEDMQAQLRVEVLLHEILHGMFETTSLRHEDSLQEEAVVTRLAKSLVALLMDNPGLIPWMAKNHPGIKLP